MVSGNNGNSIIETALIKRGWEPSDNELSYDLKWTELKSQINYDHMVEGKHLVNHIPSSSCITTKSGLLNSLRSYYGCNYTKVKNGASEMSSFFPETFRLSDCRERERLMSAVGEDDMLICKPTNSNQGKGIFLIKGKDQLCDYIEKKKKSGKGKLCSSRIVQRYISSPFLINGRKFDIRVFLLVASTRPFNVFFHNGYLRLAVNSYDKESSDLSVHLTNQYLQKKNPVYSKVKEDTIWSMEQFQEYLDNEGVTERLNLKPNWVFTDFYERMKLLAFTIFKSAQSSLAPKVGIFDLYGLDFMLDDSLNVWLIEVNTNPALHTNCKVLNDMIPPMVDETLGLCIELFDKKANGISSFPITSSINFELIYSSAKDLKFSNLMLPTFAMPNQLEGLKMINRGSELSPIKCKIPQKLSKSAPPRRIKRPAPKKPTSDSSAETSDSVSIKEDDEKMPAPVDEKPQLTQMPLKLALIEVAPCPKLDHVL